MKLTSDKTSPDWHVISEYIHEIRVNGEVVNGVISLDTCSGDYLCYAEPLSVVKGRALTLSRKSEYIEVVFNNIPDWVIADYVRFSESAKGG